MKSLYISDLDGTLFNSNKKITEYTAQVINSCIQKGMQFTIATARMAYACDYRLASLNLSTPGILTNGVFLYDFKTKKYMNVEEIPDQVVPQVIDVFEKHGKPCFLYTFFQDKLSIYYNDASLTEQTQYYSAKALEYCAEVKITPDLLLAAKNKQVVYVTLSGTEEQLAPVCEEIKQINGVAYSYYLNIYNGLYCLEVFSHKASKKTALRKLKGMFDCDEVVVFGDNLNDLSMIEIADRSYAPMNGLPEVKNKVTAVIDDCDHDGVAKFLAKEFGIVKRDSR